MRVSKPAAVIGLLSLGMSNESANAAVQDRTGLKRYRLKLTPVESDAIPGGNSGGRTKSSVGEIEAFGLRRPLGSAQSNSNKASRDDRLLQLEDIKAVLSEDALLYNSMSFSSDSSMPSSLYDSMSLSMDHSMSFPPVNSMSLSMDHSMSLPPVNSMSLSMDYSMSLPPVNPMSLSMDYYMSYPYDLKQSVQQPLRKSAPKAGENTVQAVQHLKLKNNNGNQWLLPSIVGALMVGVAGKYVMDRLTDRTDNIQQNSINDNQIV